MAEYYTAEQEVAYFRLFIHYAAIRAKKKYSAWTRDQLVLNSVTDEGTEAGELIPSESDRRVFENCELLMALESLPMQQRVVIEGIYVYNYTQRELARVLKITQSQVSKLHKKALVNLKAILRSDITSPPW